MQLSVACTLNQVYYTQNALLHTHAKIDIEVSYMYVSHI